MPQAPERLCPICRQIGCDGHYAGDTPRDPAIRRLYNSSVWRKMSKRRLTEEPYCAECDQPSTQADHIIPHRGDRKLFYRYSNTQSLCDECHAKKTRRGE